MRTDAKLKEICDILTRNCGDLHAAARMAGVSPHFVMAWVKDDEVAAKEIEEAQRVGWVGLESAAIQRAVHGVDEPVFYKGEVVGHVTKYSDALLGRVLEARVPAYKKGEAGNTFNGPTQINIMPRADSYESWLAMRDATLAVTQPPKQLTDGGPAVPEILQGEYVEVEPMPVRPLAQLEGLL